MDGRWRLGWRGGSHKDDSANGLAGGWLEFELPVLARGQVPGRAAGDANAAFFQLTQSEQAALETRGNLGGRWLTIGRANLDHAVRLEHAQVPSYGRWACARRTGRRIA